MSNWAIECRHLSRLYHDSAREGYGVEDINLRLAQGSFAVLAGPSGSGKSTLLNLIGGLDTPSSGQLIVGGVELTALDEQELALYRRRRVGFVFQSFNLISSLCATENIELPLRLLGVRERQSQVDEALARVGLDGLGQAMPADLSGGEQQRLAIARALIHQPAVLLADEPTASLDSANAMEILYLLQSLSRDTGSTILLATHDPRLIDSIDCRIELKDGHIHQLSGCG